MKKLVLMLVVLLSVAVLAQEQAAPPPVQATNLVERVAAPTYSDLYCAGFITRQAVDHSKSVAAGAETPHSTLFTTGETVFLKGGGFQENEQYMIVRELRDPNSYELFPGQRRLLSEAGQPYAELGRVRVTQARPDQAVATVEFSCQPLVPGDLALPFHEKPAIPYRQEKVAFNQFPATGQPAGRILMARDFDMFLGTGQKVYINAGSDKGIKIGDYLRVMRGYDPAEMDPADALSYKTPSGEDTQRSPMKHKRQDLQRLPRRALGEIIILNVTPTSATGMITLAVDSIKVGDTVVTEQ